MKVTIEIEQFDNGISIKWSDPNMEVDPHDIVALDRDKEQAIGKMILDDVKHLMDYKSANVVNMAIEYLTKEDEE